MDKDERNISVKNHMKLAGKVIYCYFLGLIMAWAGLPIISIFTMRNTYDGVSKNLFLPEALAESEFFYFENIHNIWWCKRFKIKTVGSVKVGTYSFRVIVDDCNLVAQFV